MRTHSSLTRRLARRPWLEVLEDRSLPSATLLHDVNTDTPNGVYYTIRGGEYIADLVRSGNYVYFMANDGLRGAGLWRTNGTEGGTQLVKDVSGLPESTIAQLTDVNGTLFFTDDPFGETRSLYKSNGTEAGTVLVKGGDDSMINVRQLTNVNGSLFFVADDLTTGKPNALWRSNGTQASTIRLLDGNQGVGNDETTNLTNVNGTLYFRYTDSSGVTGLWKSDGSKNGTQLVRTFAAIPPSFEQGNIFAALGNRLVFVAEDTAGDREVWVSDGTTTTRLLDLRPGLAGSAPFGLTTVGGLVYFAADDGVNGRELWRTDGTPAGTFRIDVAPGPDSSNPSRMRDVGGKVFFFTSSGLYVSEGTAASTSFVAATSVSSVPGLIGRVPVYATAVNNLLYFRSATGGGGNELWRSDGTGPGTFPVRVVPGAAGSDPHGLVNLNGTLLFSATDPAHGRELWRSDGTEATTTLVKDVNATTLGSAPKNYTLSNDKVFFTTEMSFPTLTALWVSTGNAITKLVEVPGTTINGPVIRQLKDVNGVLYFTVKSPEFANHYQLWRSDGTPGGTFSVTGLTGPIVREFVSFNGAVYFADGTDFSPGNLWRTDGTPGNFTFVLSAEGNFLGRVSGLTVFNGSLYFAGQRAGISPNEGVELWKSNGTSAGTSLFKDVAVGSAAASPSGFLASGAFLYFTADDGVGGRELWKTDGTPGNTGLVVNLNPTGSSSPADLTDVNGTLYFTADDGTGRKLWKTTGLGATLVATGDLGELEAVNDKLFFRATDSSAGAELWVTDTTGTRRVIDLRPGPEWSFPSNLTAVGGAVYFSADDGVNGKELWRSDGTDVGTLRVLGVDSPGLQGSFPSELVVINGTLYFTARSVQHGIEVWIDRSEQDPDVDGVSNVVEEHALNNGDGNYDGIPDSQQVNVTSLPNSADAQYVTLASPTGTLLGQVAAVPNPSPGNAPANIEFPMGHLDFTVLNVTAGGATTVTLYLPDDTRVSSWWKYGPTPGNLTPHWYEFLFDGTTGAEIFAGNDGDSDPEQIVLHFVDGQRGDNDVTANGRVIDPGAPAVRVVPVTIDVRPGTFPNPINLGAQGAVPVAILSTATFDATTVDPITVTLAGAGVRLRGNGTPQASHQDLNADGRLDLLVQVSTQAMELTVGDVQAVLKGWTYGGLRIQGTDTVRVINGLHAAETGPGTEGTALTQARAQATYAQALSRWGAASGSIPQEVELVVTDLPGSLLGTAGANVITLDIDAAGWGWFVDPTPWEDNEFYVPGDQGEQGRMDLLSALMHELGHVLGHDHEEEGFMHETLAPGERHGVEERSGRELTFSATRTVDRGDGRRPHQAAAFEAQEPIRWHDRALPAWFDLGDVVWLLKKERS